MYRIRRVPAAAVKDFAAHALTDEDGDPVWSADGRYWAAFLEREMVAYAGLRVSRQWARVAYFHCSGVLEAHRGHHLQRRLIRARQRWCREIGFTHAITYTMVDNPASARSLLACGFRPYWPGVQWAGRQAYWIWKCTS